MKKEIIKFLVLLMVAVGAGPSFASLWQWSKTAGSNATADPSINWAEGMAPSSVNDSARAMMAAVASYRDDISGLLTTGGTATAYTVTTNQGLASTPDDGQLLAITMHASNGTSPTIQVDGGLTRSIFASAGVPPASGTMVIASPYTLKYSAAYGAWFLRDFYSSPTNIPLGGMIAYTGTTVPNSNFIFPAGQCISTTTYAAYWALRGSPASGSCPGGQFAVIDMSGRVPAGLDTMPGFAAANRLTASASGCGTAMTSVGSVCANGLESWTLTTAQIPPVPYSGVTGSENSQHTHGFSAATPSGTFSDVTPGSVQGSGSLSGTTATENTQHTHNYSGTISGGGGGHPSVPPIIGVPYLLRVL